MKMKVISLLILNLFIFAVCDSDLIFLGEPSPCGTPTECYLNAINEMKNMKVEFQDTIAKLKQDQQKLIQDQEKTFKDNLQKLQNLTPIIGSIVYYSSGKAILEDKDVPYGWIYCDGRNLKISDYSDLYAIIGTSYGQVDSSSFNIPDLRGRVVVGTGQGSGLSEYKIGQKGGEENHYLTSSEMPNHTHSVNAKFMHINTGNVVGDGFTKRVKMPYIDLDGNNNWKSWMYPSLGQDSISSYAAGNGAAHNNMQPYVSIHPIIKVK